ncbi:aldo/keto reductase [Ornatilinea apprima]|uniref:Aldo/keto reductase n=1 Tax=Ornatilinea apprima TaxID=1134406 RepID=A0A0P6XB78_9CHLR|nr:aldo/keto reductase [Ornatilinea apprima]KPL76990.1 aldo/keto reductase [Ornatilinea apprima]
MEYRFLGKTGVRVSKLCFGAMSFAKDADEAESAALYRRCREAGINFFDCADVYSNGQSEEYLGRFIASERDQVVITSKVYFPSGAGVNDRGSSRYHIVRSVEGSLRRLNTDRIDVYFLHRFDDFTDLEETLRALDDLVRQGKILYPAVSNFAAWQVEKALGISAREGLARLVCLQPMYNLVKRQAEVELLPMAQAEGLGVIAYSPLGGGLLSGKYDQTHRPEDGRLMTNKMYMARYKDDWMYAAAGDLNAFARQNGWEPAALAVAWVMSHPAITAPIIGARNVRQLESSLKSLEIEMTTELRERVSAFTPEPPPATDRNDERDIDFMGKR